MITRYPIQKQPRKSFAILSLQVSRDMNSIVDAPLTLGASCSRRMVNTLGFFTGNECTRPILGQTRHLDPMKLGKAIIRK